VGGGEGPLHADARGSGGEALLPGLDWSLDWNPNSARTILSYTHLSARAGFLKTL